MELSSEIVGTGLAEYHTRVEPLHVKSFAASTYDLNPIYFDDARGETLVAPPLYASALNWPVINGLKDYFHLLNPEQIRDNFLHQSEYIQYNRLFQPYDKITVQGKVVAILPHQKGAKIYMKFNYVHDNGDVLQTEYCGGIILGAQCLDTGLGEEELPTINRIETPSEPLWQVECHVPYEAPYIFAGCSGNSSSLNVSRKAAQSAGFPDITMQGNAVLAFAVKELVNRETNGNPAFIQSLSCEFIDPVMPGSTLQIRLLHKENYQFEGRLWFDVLTDNRQTAIADGLLCVTED